MRGAYINFCDKRGFNLVDENLKQSIIDSLKDNYYITISDRNFYILNKKNIRNIETKPFILSVKSLGSLYYLYLTKIEEKNYCIFINRRLKDGHKFPLMVSAMYRFDDEYYSNTLFDGELLRDNNNNWLFIINNLILEKGELLKNRNIIQKLNKVYNILTNHYKKDDYLELCPLYVKRLFGYHEIDYIIKKYIPSLPYKSRGIYFEGIRDLKNYLYLFPRNQKFVLQQIDSDSIAQFVPEKEEMKLDFKEKKPIKKIKKEEIISDRTNMVFMARKTEQSDIYNLYCIKDREIVKYGIAEIDSLRTSKNMRKYFKGNNGNDKDNINIVCSYNSEKGKWVPQKCTDNQIDNFNSINNIVST